MIHDFLIQIHFFLNQSIALCYKIKFEIVLKNNNIYIRFNTGVMFEPNILKKSNDMKTLWIYYNVLKFVATVTIKINKLLKDVQI